MVDKKSTQQRQHDHQPVTKNMVDDQQSTNYQKQFFYYQKYPKNFATKTLIMKIIMMIVTIIIINKTRIRQPTHVRCLKHFQWFKQLTKSKEKKFSK